MKVLFKSIEKTARKTTNPDKGGSALSFLWKMMLWPLFYLNQFRGWILGLMRKADSNTRPVTKFSEGTVQQNKSFLSDAQKSIATHSKALAKTEDSLVKANAKIHTLQGKKRRNAQRDASELVEEIDNLRDMISSNQADHRFYSKKLNKLGRLHD